MNVSRQGGWLARTRARVSKKKKKKKGKKKKEEEKKKNVDHAFPVISHSRELSRLRESAVHHRDHDSPFFTFFPFGTQGIGFWHPCDRARE